MLERIWRWLTNWCRHHWEIHQEVRVWASDSDKYAMGSKFILRYTKCGDIKVKETY